MKRIFIALKPDKRILSKINDVRSQIGKGFINWYCDEDTHSTIVRPWLEKDISRTIATLEEIRETYKFAGNEELKINFNCVCPGPDPQKPSLIWTLGTANKNTKDLHRILNSKMFSDPQERPYLPHITLGRRIPEHQIPLDMKLDIDWQLETDTIYIMESLLNRKEKRYEILYSIKF
jgi:2'-5' RNA ligase